MSRSVRTFLPVVGDPVAVAAAFDDDPARWLPGARRDGHDRYTIALRAGAFTRTVRAKIGASWCAGETRWRSLAWDSIGDDGDPEVVDHLLPSLDGELGLHTQSGRVTLLLDGRYLPPGGTLGEAIDSLALQRLARTTVERFLEEVTARLAGEALLLDDGPVPSLSGDRPDHHRAPVGAR